MQNKLTKNLILKISMGSFLSFYELLKNKDDDVE